MSFNEFTHLQQKAESASDIGQFELAAQCATQAIAASPDQPDGFASLARALLGQEKFGDAIVQIRAAISMDPNEAWYFQLLSIIQYFQDDYKSALSSIQEGLRLSPYDANLQHRLGLIQHELHDYPQAIQAFDTAIEIDVHHAGAFRGLANTYLATEQFDMAEQCFRQALELQPTHARTLNNFGVCLDRQNKLKEAALAYKAALVADPTLQVAKTNTKSAIGRFLPGIGGGTIFLIYITIKILTVSQRGFEQNFTIYLTVALVLSAAIFGGYMIYVRSKAKRDLNQADPQLLEIYNKLKRDRTA